MQELVDNELIGHRGLVKLQLHPFSDRMKQGKYF